MAEKYTIARLYFEERMKMGIRPMLYNLTRLAGGEYASVFTEMAWKDYLAGWQAGGTRRGTVL